MLKYLKSLFIQGLWIALIGTGVALVLAVSLGWQLNWSYLRLTNYILFAVTGVIGLWIATAGPANNNPRTPCEAHGRNLVVSGGWERDGHLPISGDLFPTGWRIFCRSFAPLALGLIFHALELWL